MWRFCVTVVLLTLICSHAFAGVTRDTRDFVTLLNLETPFTVGYLTVKKAELRGSRIHIFIRFAKQLPRGSSIKRVVREQFTHWLCIVPDSVQLMYAGARFTIVAKDIRNRRINTQVRWKDCTDRYVYE